MCGVRVSPALPCLRVSISKVIDRLPGRSTHPAMSNVQVLRSPAIAAQQLAMQRENINLNHSLTPKAKTRHVRCVEGAFANAMYGQTLSWPARIVWAVCSILAALAWSCCNSPVSLEAMEWWCSGGWRELRALGNSGRTGESCR